MKINKAKSSDYDTITTSSLVRYIQDAAKDIAATVQPGDMGAREKLAACDRTQLKAIAAELETVQKRLGYVLYGQY